MIRLQLINAVILGYLFTATVFAANFTSTISEDSSMSTPSGYSSQVINVPYGALLIVDVWPTYDGDDAPELIPAVLLAIEDAKTKKLPIILVDFIGAPETAPEILNSLSDLGYPFKKIKKDSYSAFYKTRLDEYLRNNKLNNIFIVGASTHRCIESTLNDGLQMGFRFVTSAKFLDDGLPNVTSPQLQPRFKTF